jgi:Uma2 family endonuclease
MVAIAKRRATYQDVLDAPAHLVAEIMAGELVLSPRPRLGHGMVQSSLSSELREPFGRGRGGPGGWVFFLEPELHLDRDIVVPDVAAWRRERSPDPRDAFATTAPDWACEVLSPSTEKHDRGKKLTIYASAGVRHAWLVNPDQRTLEILRHTEAGWLRVGTHADDDRIRAEPFDAIELDLSALWFELPPPAP